MGRPTVLTPERQKAILDAIKKGHSQRDAAAMCGVHEGTIIEWRNKGKQPGGRRVYRQFAEAWEKAVALNMEALINSAYQSATETTTRRIVTKSTVRDRDGNPVRDAQGKLVVEVTERVEHIPPNGMLALEMAARRRPSEWGRRTAIEHSGPSTDTGPGPIVVRFVNPGDVDAEGEQ